MQKITWNRIHEIFRENDLHIVSSSQDFGQLFSVTVYLAIYGFGPVDFDEVPAHIQTIFRIFICKFSLFTSAKNEKIKALKFKISRKKKLF